MKFCTFHLSYCFHVLLWLFLCFRDLPVQLKLLTWNHKRNLRIDDHFYEVPVKGKITANA